MGNRTKIRSRSASPMDVEARQRSERIDQQLLQSRRFRDQQFTLLVLGPSHSGKSTLINHYKASAGMYTPRERDNYRRTIFSRISKSIRIIVSLARERGLLLDGADFERHAQALEKPPSIQTDAMLRAAGRAVESLWSDGRIVDLVHVCRQDGDLDESIHYFFNNMTRIASAQYIPNDQDIIRLHVRTIGIEETVTPIGDDATLRICEVGHQVSDPRKWLHHFDDASMLIYVVPTAEYDTPELRESLDAFISLCDTECISRPRIALLFGQMDRFQEKLRRRPLREHFPDYCGGEEDAAAASEYLAGMFTQACPRERIDTFFAYGLDQMMMGLLITAINDLLRRSVSSPSRSRSPRSRP